MQAGNRIAVAAILSLSFVACSDDSVDTAAAETQIGMNPSAETRYLHELRSPDSYLTLRGNWSDDLLLRVGYVNCAALDDGWSIENVMAAMLEGNAHGDDASAILLAGIDHLCPRNEHKLMDFLGNASSG